MAVDIFAGWKKTIVCCMNQTAGNTWCCYQLLCTMLNGDYVTKESKVHTGDFRLVTAFQMRGVFLRGTM